MKPSEILKKARDLIINRGWTQGAYARAGGIKAVELETISGIISNADSFCSLGAIYSADILEMAGDSNTAHAIDYLQRVVVCEFTRFDMFIAYWNDMPGRTKEQVIDAFDEAIELAESEGA
jgi:hypothetical protein